MASVRDGEQPAAAYWPLTKSLLQLAAPSAFSYFLNFALQVVSIISVGHLGEIELGAAGAFFFVFSAPLSD